MPYLIKIIHSPILTPQINSNIITNSKFIELCSEETPMVRRAVASKIGVENFFQLFTLFISI